MADVKVQNTEQLLDQLEKVSNEIHNAREKNPREDETKDLDDLTKVLEEIRGRLTPQDPVPVKKDDDQLLPPQDPVPVKKDDDQLLPPQDPVPVKKGDDQLLPDSKREELDILLKEMDVALQQRRRRRRHPESERRPALQKKLLSVAAGCNPLNKLMRPSSQEKKIPGGGGEQDGEADEEVSLKLLVRLAKHVLEPEQYYEWTTSYVDESRIYGWDDEAGRVVDALIDPEEGDFRAAAIFGIHGSGKTALAQKVFVHDRAKDNFPIRLWVCVGPPHWEDKFNLLYRMLDNLGLDTNRVEDVAVDGDEVVKKAREIEEERINRDPAEVEAMKSKAREIVEAMNSKAREIEDKDAKVNKEFDKLLKEKIENSPTVVKSKIGVLLRILHVTLSKTGYLIVFDDIRVYDDWYSNLTLSPPPEGEWCDRLAYGLPKATPTKHRNAVLVTCRKEDDARTMVRTGRVSRPPELDVDNGWKLFEREYKQARELSKDSKENKEKKDLLFKELGEMKKKIVEKCLGLPVAIIEAARGFALSDLGPLLEEEPAKGKTESSNKGTQTEEATEAANTESTE